MPIRRVSTKMGLHLIKRVVTLCQGKKTMFVTFLVTLLLAQLVCAQGPNEHSDGLKTNHKYIALCGATHIAEWEFIDEDHNCTMFSVGQCRPNKENNFKSQEFFHPECQPSKALEVCSEVTEQRYCSGQYPRWKFNRDTRRCEEFTWGCELHNDRFDTKAACSQQCAFLSKSDSADSVTECQPTVSRVRGSGLVCSGQTLFEDNFSSLSEDVWQVEQYIPLHHPEYPFVSYQRLQEQPTVSTSNGFLRIQPTLQQNVSGFNDESIYSGLLNLFRGCTAEACKLSASGADILPPVVSGRITSKSFAFTYGTVHVRAKLPQGDWLYPEILLEPFLKKYGSQQFESGVLKIATARGNSELYNGQSDYSNKVLYGGPIMDFECRNRLVTQKALVGRRKWGDEYHLYSLRWEPERITLSVDGEAWASVEPEDDGLVSLLPQSCKQVPRELLSLGSKMAPFDDHFYLTLGVAAGGVTEFPSGSITGDNHPIPWSNNNPKAKLHFWQDKDTWTKTWTQPGLSVDYVKVFAL